MPLFSVQEIDEAVKAKKKEKYKTKLNIANKNEDVKKNNDKKNQGDVKSEKEEIKKKININSTPLLSIKNEKKDNVKQLKKNEKIDNKSINRNVKDDDKEIKIKSSDTLINNQYIEKNKIIVTNIQEDIKELKVKLKKQNQTLLDTIRMLRDCIIAFEKRINGSLCSDSETKKVLQTYRKLLDD